MSAAIAVLEYVPMVGDVVRVTGAGWHLNRKIAGVEDLAALARRLDARQLWVHPSWSKAHPEVQLCSSCAREHARRQEHEHWLPLNVAQPDLNPRAQLARFSSDRPQSARLAIVLGDTSLPHELRETADGTELLGVLSASAYLLGTSWHGTGGRTGQVLLEDCLKRAGHKLTPLPDELRHFPIEPDFGWQRAPTSKELRRRWLYCFDKHNQYLTAAQSVVLGVGEPEFRAAPTFHARTPAYWHTKLGSWPADSPLPDPTLAAGPTRDASTYRWLTTPSVEAALSAGLVEDIAAAWYWPVHGRYLQALANLLRRAIVALAERTAAGDRPAVLVRGVVKSVYAELLSGYLAPRRLSKTDDPHYRRDWRDMVKAEARTRLWYSLRPLATAGLAPIAVARDSIYIPSDADTPGEALAGLLRLGDRPTQWALKSRVALAAVIPALSDDVESCRGLVAAVGAAKRR